MITLSNYQMLRNFKFKPERFGFLTGEEVKTIMGHFQIAERSNICLQNLRDFVVMYYSDKTRDDMETMDIMSGIVGVIDQEKFNRGMEV